MAPLFSQQILNKCQLLELFLHRFHRSTEEYIDILTAIVLYNLADKIGIQFHLDILQIAEKHHRVPSQPADTNLFC